MGPTLLPLSCPPGPAQHNFIAVQSVKRVPVSCLTLVLGKPSRMTASPSSSSATSNSSDDCIFIQNREVVQSTVTSAALCLPDPAFLGYDVIDARCRHPHGRHQFVSRHSERVRNSSRRISPG